MIVTLCYMSLFWKAIYATTEIATDRTVTRQAREKATSRSTVAQVPSVLRRWLQSPFV